MYNPVCRQVQDTQCVPIEETKCDKVYEDKCEVTYEVGSVKVSQVGCNQCLVDGVCGDLHYGE